MLSLEPGDMYADQLFMLHAKLGIPTIIHEQNSVPGLTNKFLSRYVDRIAVCFEEARSFFPEEKVVLTGNPRASEVLNQDGIKGRLSVGLNLTEPVVLIVGGSRGARPINDAVVQSLSQLGKSHIKYYMLRVKFIMKR